MGVEGESSNRVRVQHDAGDRFKIKIRQHDLAVDQPVEDGGAGTAPTPTELFVARLASRVASYVRRFLSRRGLPVDRLAVSSEVELAARTHRVGGIRPLVEGLGALTEEQRTSVLAVASRCTVHNSLPQAPDVTIATEAAWTARVESAAELPLG